MPPTASHTWQSRMLPALAADVPNTQNANVPIGAATYISGDLPAGWEQRYVTTGRVYFVNHHDVTTTWVHPRQDHQLIRSPGYNPSNDHAHPTLLTTFTRAIPKSRTDAATPDSKGFPPGWEQCHTPEGRAYFINHNKRVTTWADPRQQKHTYANNRISNSDEVSSKTQPMSHTPKLSTQLATLVHPNSIGKLYSASHKNDSVTWREPQEPSPLDYKEFTDTRRPREADPREVVAKCLLGASTGSQSEGVAGAQTSERSTREGKQADARIEIKAAMGGKGTVYKQSCQKLRDKVFDEDEYVKVEYNTDEDDWEMI